MGGLKLPKIKISNPIQQIKDLQWKDLDPTNKHGALAGNLRDLDKQVLQPLEQVTLTAAFVSIPYAGPLAAAYFASLFSTSGPHQALPMWLKIVLEDLDLFPHLDLTKVAYHEGCQTVEVAITVGYNIFIRRDINIDHPNPNRMDVHTILHELVHVNQYERGGGVEVVFPKFVLQYGDEALAQLGKLTSGASLRNIHDDGEMEREAQAFADANVDRVMQRGRVLQGLRDAPRRRIGGGGGSGLGIGQVKHKMQEHVK